MSDMINTLRDYENVTRAIMVLDGGGRIASMTLASVPGASIPMGVTIDTQNMPYPPQMTQSILASLRERQSQIADELAGMGITGLDQATRKSS